GGTTGKMVNLSCSPACDLSSTSAVLMATSSPVPVTVHITPMQSGANLTATVNGSDGTKVQNLSFIYSVQDFTLSAPASAALLAGTSSGYQFSVTPIAGYTGVLTAMCDVSQIPGATCTLSPQPVNISSSNAQAVTATIIVP